MAFDAFISHTSKRQSHLRRCQCHPRTLLDPLHISFHRGNKVWPKIKILPLEMSGPACDGPPFGAITPTNSPDLTRSGTLRQPQHPACPRCASKLLKIFTGCAGIFHQHRLSLDAFYAASGPVTCAYLSRKSSRKLLNIAEKTGGDLRKGAAVDETIVAAFEAIPLPAPNLKGPRLNCNYLIIFATLKIRSTFRLSCWDILLALITRCCHRRLVVANW